MHMLKKLIAVLFMTSWSFHAISEVIFDTGNYATSPYPSYTVNDSYSYFGLVNLTSYVVIDEFEVFASTGLIDRNGQVYFEVYENSPNNTMGNLLFSKGFNFVNALEFDWYGVSNLGWGLVAGNYWFGMKNTNTVGMVVGRAAPNPLSLYTNSRGLYGSFDVSYRAFSFEDTLSVKEPNSILALILSTSTFFILLRRRKRTFKK